MGQFLALCISLAKDVICTHGASPLVSDMGLVSLHLLTVA